MSWSFGSSRFFALSAVAGMTLAFVAGITVCTPQARAFCVYNKAVDTSIHVKQTGGGGLFASFNETIAPGQRTCCNWRTSSCNWKGKKASSLTFKITDNHGLLERSFCERVSIQAGGWVDVYREYVNGHDREHLKYYCKGHNP